MTKSRTLNIALTRRARQQKQRQGRWRELCEARQAARVREAERAAQSRELADAFIGGLKAFHALQMRELERRIAELRARSR